MVRILFHRCSGFNNKSFRWITEKLDGVRAFWNGNKLLSKHGKEIVCPSWYISKLPQDISLDGELWLGRGTFELLNGTLNSNEDESAWKNICYMVFDSPNSKDPYETRVRDLAHLELPNSCQIVDMERCRGKDHLRQTLVEMMNHGGEGLMVNKPNSMYFNGRTQTLLKVKVFL
jgi:DNA ligase-1